MKGFSLSTQISASRRKIPLPVKLGYTLLVAVVVPAYWQNYGPKNFLWFSDLALLLIAVSVWTENRLLNSMMAVGILPLELIWTFDFAVGVLTGTHPFQLTLYTFDPKFPLFLRSLTLFHAVLPLVIIFLLLRLGYDRRAFKFQWMLTWTVLLTTFGLTGPEDNINWVYGPGRIPQTWLPPLIYLGLFMGASVLIVLVPMHALLSRIFLPRPK